MPELELAEVFPAGDFIREEREARNWTQGDLAQIMGTTVQTVNALESESPRGLTPDMAQAVGQAFGTGPQYWMNLETLYRLSRVEEPRQDVARRAAIFNKAPVKDMIRRTWIKDTKDANELEEEIVSFFCLESIGDAPEFLAAARKSTRYDSTTSGQMAWYYRSRHLASTLHVETFTKKRFTSGLLELRQLATAPEESRRVAEVLANMGVRFVVVEALPKTKIDGVAFWLDKRKPCIALSLRYDRIDWFWHTLGHELGHIASGDALNTIDTDLVGNDKRRDQSEEEVIADDFAASLTVPQDKLNSFIKRVRPLYSKSRINQFANLIGVHPGIVVGQLQFRDEIGYSHSRETLAKVRREITSSALTDGWGSVLQIKYSST